MNKTEFENALMSTIVEYISDQIVLRYMDACKQAVVLFSGALIGYQDAVPALNELKKDGWKLTAVLSKAAGEVLTKERISSDIDPDAIYVEGAPVDGRQIIDSHQFVIIPELTINTAAKVANCISDNLLTNMISRAMATGKPIVAAIDGCCPDNQVRAKLGFKVTDAYKARMRRNLEDLRDYGIVLTVNANLCHKVNKVYESSFNFPRPGADKEPVKEVKSGSSCNLAMQVMPAGTSIRLDKKVIGRIDIAQNFNFGTITVRRDAIVTGLARDEAAKRGVKIVKE
ncbi:MAG: flavoprotein [Eubacterium sp.]|nr:flavoprotein [Eubacterium sp.]